MISICIFGRQKSRITVKWEKYKFSRHPLSFRTRGSGDLKSADNPKESDLDYVWQEIEKGRSLD